MSLHIPPEQLGFSVDPANLPALAQQVAQPADEMQAEAEERAVPAEWPKNLWKTVWLLPQQIMMQWLFLDADGCRNGPAAF